MVQNPPIEETPQTQRAGFLGDSIMPSMRSLMFRAVKMQRAFTHGRKTKRLKTNNCPKCTRSGFTVKTEEINTQYNQHILHCNRCGYHDELIMAKGWEPLDAVDHSGDLFRKALEEASAQKLEAEIPATF